MVIVERAVERSGSDRPADCSVVAVRESLAALGDLAAYHRRRRRQAQVLAVAGSNGKTTTKEMTAAILRAAFGADAVLQTHGTQNNLVGLPLTLLRLGESQRVAVLELGMNGPGEVWRLAEIASPDVGVITCVAPEHLEGVGLAARRRRGGGRALPPAAAVGHGGGERRRPARGRRGRRRFRAAPCASGPVARCAPRASSITASRAARSSSASTANGRAVRLPVAGRHNVGNALAAAALASLAGTPLDATRRALERFEPPSMRMQVMRLAAGITVINDAYNANPASMAAALQTLAASAAARRIAVLGEMRELGDHTEAAHEELGRVAGGGRLDAAGRHRALRRRWCGTRRWRQDCRPTA